jgi:PTS system nitrogen regulatory IIA component
MDIRDLIGLKRIIPDLKVTSKKQLLQEISDFAGKVSNFPAHDILNIISQREKLGTTGMGYGIAIPHGKFKGLKETIGFFIRLNQPVNFDSIDGEPVDLIIMLMAPENAGADHLKALARVSRLLRDSAIREKLRGSVNPDALFAVMVSSEKTQKVA